jgi:hypothetical protein
VNYVSFVVDEGIGIWIIGGKLTREYKTTLQKI